MATTGLIRRILDSPTTENVIRVMVVISFFGMIFVGQREYSLAHCLASYDNTAAAINAQRINAADQDRASQDKLFNSIASDPRHAIEAVGQYNIQRAQANKLRAANALPEPPSLRC